MFVDLITIYIDTIQSITYLTVLILIIILLIFINIFYYIIVK